MHFDEILTNVGGFGLYQKVQYVLLGTIAVLPGFQNMLMVFIGGGDHRHWCHVTQLANMSADQQRYISIPYNRYSRESYQGCKKFDIDWSKVSESDYKSWNRTLRTPDGTKTVGCGNVWDYDIQQYTSTLASEFNLVCGREWMTTLITTIYMAGFLVGCIFFGHLSDRFGRHLTLYVCIVIQFVFTLAAAFSPNYVMFVVMRFLAGTAVAGGYTTSFVTIVEIIGPKYRVICCLMYQSFFAVGYMLLVMFAYFIRDMMWLQIVFILPLVPMLSYWWLIPKSPRWLISENRHDEARDILNKMARMNKRPELKEGFFEDEKDEEEESPSDADAKDDKHGSIIVLMKYPALRRISLIVFFNWFVNSIIYYGLSFSTSLMGGNIYLSSFIMACIEVPAQALSVLLVEKLGRRCPLVGTMMGGGLACLLCIPFLYYRVFVPGLVTMAMLGKFGIAASFSIIYLYSSEVFPTVVRNVGVGTGSMFARVGGLVAPEAAILSKYWLPLPSIIFGSLALAGSLLALYLPETLNRDLPETLEEGEDFVRSSKLQEKAEDKQPLTESTKLKPS